MVEAWGPTRAACAAEAVWAVLESFTAPADASATEVLPLSVPAGPDIDVLMAVVEEVVSLVSVFGLAPVRLHLADTEDGGMAGDVEIVRLRSSGPPAAPHGLSPQGATFGDDGGLWRCRAVVAG